MHSLRPPEPESKTDGKFAFNTVKKEGGYYGKYDTRREALEAGRDEHDGAIWTGRIEDPGFASTYAQDGDAIIEQIWCGLHDEAGEWAEAWRPSKADTEQLSNMISKTIDHWFKETKQDWGFFMIRDIEEHDPKTPLTDVED